MDDDVKIILGNDDADEEIDVVVGAENVLCCG